MEKRIEGVIAAMLTPRLPGGRLDLDGFYGNIEFVLQAGVRGICILGATGEYPTLQRSEREMLFSVAARALAGRGPLITGAGSATFRECVDFGRWALERGADALLVSPPHFFPYSAGDVYAFYSHVAARLEGPILLYNIPRFTTAIEKQTVLQLMQETQSIRGMKDSSGAITTLLSVRQRFGTQRACITGDDSILVDALKAGCCDAVISGVAGVCPEIIVSTYQSAVAASDSSLDKHRDVLGLLLRELDKLPVPWGLKWIAEARKLSQGGTTIPLADFRQEQRRLLRQWYHVWAQEADALLGDGGRRADS